MVVDCLSLIESDLQDASRDGLCIMTQRAKRWHQAKF